MVIGEGGKILVKVGNSEGYHKQVKDAEEKARKAEKSEAARLANRIAWTWTIARGGPVHCGREGTSFLNVALSIL